MFYFSVPEQDLMRHQYGDEPLPVAYRDPYDVDRFESRAWAFQYELPPCAYCGEYKPPRLFWHSLHVLKRHNRSSVLRLDRQSQMTIDHVVPQSKGGSNAPSNCVPCCRSCNSKKGTMGVSEFVRRIW